MIFRWRETNWRNSQANTLLQSDPDVLICSIISIFSKFGKGEISDLPPVPSLLPRPCTKIMVVLRTRFLAPKDAVRCRSKPERKKVFPEGLETFAGSLGLAGWLPGLSQWRQSCFLVAKLPVACFKNYFCTHGYY